MSALFISLNFGSFFPFVVAIVAVAVVVIFVVDIVIPRVLLLLTEPRNRRNKSSRLRLTPLSSAHSNGVFVRNYSSGGLIRWIFANSSISIIF